MTARSTLVSIAIHVAAIALLLLASNQIAPAPLRVPAIALTPLPAPFLPHPAPGKALGGGGMHQQLPATTGHLPKIAARQFVPPILEILNPHPKLAMEMTIEVPPQAALLDRPLPDLGDPLSKFMNGSAGMGGPLGIGNGRGTGIGDRRGSSAGNGDSTTGTVYKPGNGVTAPVLIHCVEPEFSEEARKAKRSGVVKLLADIDASGRPRNIRVVQSLGVGLDERAIGALELWQLKPGTKDGKPVAVSALVEVSFHLL
jgi:protein TonB